ncbi:MAG: hypothetical protein RLY87_1128 [Chloroflexota bacterium]|jgi:hypothetical protein
MSRKTVVHSLAELQTQIDELLVTRTEQGTWQFDGAKSVFQMADMQSTLLNGAADVQRAAVESIAVERTQSGTKQTITVSLVYRESAAQYAAVQAAVQRIVADQIRPGMSSHEQALVLHDWVVQHFTYDQSRTKMTAYDGFVTGTTVCAGYAAAYAQLCEAVGIPVRIVSGESTTTKVRHGWNLICLDGIWYHVDVTWDSPHSDAPSTHAAYSYYLLSDAEIQRDHRITPEPGEPAYPVARTRYQDYVTAALQKKHPASTFLRTVPQRIGLQYGEAHHTLIGVAALADHLLRLYSKRQTHTIMRYVPTKAGVSADFDAAWKDASTQFYGVGCSIKLTALPYTRAGGEHDVLLDISLTWQ